MTFWFRFLGKLLLQQLGHVQCHWGQRLAICKLFLFDFISFISASKQSRTWQASFINEGDLREASPWSLISLCEGKQTAVGERGLCVNHETAAGVVHKRTALRWTDITGHEVIFGCLWVLNLISIWINNSKHRCHAIWLQLYGLVIRV